jgi:hypothetical protein
MKKTIFTILILIIYNIILAQNINFSDYFINKTLRMDYLRAGNNLTSQVFFEQFKQEPFWGGSQKNIIDTFNYGHYRLQVFDNESNILIYSIGYASLFQEWQATDEAKKINRSFYETVIMPYPKKEIKIILQERDKQNIFHDVFSTQVSPDNMFIVKDLKYNYKTSTFLNNGDPKNKIDIVCLAEGYTKNEMEKFKKDVKQLFKTFFKYEPFLTNKKSFNIHLVESISEESGTDIPGDSIWKNTILNTNFYTFGSERYITTMDIETVRDVAAIVPYDQIYIIVNTDKYGGGGIYNFYNLCVADHSSADLVFLHEFGHGFGALADEYWDSDVAVEDYYDLTVEPYSPNITTLVNFDKKWKKMIEDSIPIPTPSIKKYIKKIGVFEGGGYVEKGVYRAQQNCMMRALSYPFCKVCQKSLEQVIKFYTE